MPKISVIIPVYNVEHCISRTINSILNQTLTDIELILVDDCGTDNSFFICKEYEKKEKRIRLVYQDRNSGPMVARQKGIAKSNGKYIFFCDSDDTIPDDALELLFNKAEESEADIVCGDIQYISSQGDKRLFCGSHCINETDRVIIYKSLLKHKLTHNLCGKLFKSILFKNYNYRIEDRMRNAEDAMIFYQVIEHINKIVCINNIVYNYIENPQSSSNKQFSISQVEDIVKFANFQKKYLSKYSSIEIDLNRYIIHNINFLIASVFYVPKKTIYGLLYKYNLSKTVHFKYMIRYFSLAEVISMRINTTILRTMRKVRNLFIM